MKGKTILSSVVEVPAALPRAWPRPRLRALFFRPRGDSAAKRLLIHLALWAACAVAVYPVLRVVTISLRPANKLLTTSLAIIPEDATLANYIELLVGRPGRPTEFYLWIWNSLIITLTTATVGLLLSATAAYAFSRFRFPGRNAGLIFLLSTQMFPAAMLLLPLFIMISRLGLIDSYLGLVIAYSVTAVPVSIWILKGYYDTIPRDLEEAAMIDGASRLGVLWHIIRPLSTPALAIAFLFNFMSGWSEYIVARIILHKREMYTWPLGLWTFTEQYTVLWGKFAAASILVERDLITSNTLGALQRKLGLLHRFGFLAPQVPGAEDAVGQILSCLLNGRSVVLEFGRYGNDMAAYVLVANYLTRRIHEEYVRRMERALGDPAQEPPHLVIVIEEAHKFLQPGIAEHTVFGTIARELRKYNVTLLIVDQRPSQIDGEVLSQIGTRVLCLLDHEDDVRAALAGVPGGSRLREVLARLETKQQALLLGHAVPMPVVVRTRPYDEGFYRELERETGRQGLVERYRKAMDED